MGTTAHELGQKDFVGLPLSEPYGSVLGEIWPGFQVLIWGEKGAGKSTQTILCATALTAHAAAAGGSVMILSAEEGVGVGVQRRLDRVGIPDEARKKIIIEEWTGMDDLKDAIDRHDVKWLVVDSISVVDVRGLNLIDYCRKKDIGTLLVAHARKGGWTYKGNSRIGHEVDAVLKAYQNEAGEYMLGVDTKNRAVDTPPDDVPAPKNVAELGPHPDPAEMMRENPDCSVEEGEEQSDRCKAIMASLRSEGQLDADEFEEGEDVSSEDIEETPDPDETDVEAEDPEDLSEKSDEQLLSEITDLLDQAETS